MNRRDFLKSGVAAAAVALCLRPSGLQAQERGIVRYPDPWIEVIDARFGRMVPGMPRSSGCIRARDGRKVRFGLEMAAIFLWSDIPNNRILRWVEKPDR